MGDDNGEHIAAGMASNAEIMATLIRQGESIAAWRGSSDTQLANILKILLQRSTISAPGSKSFPILIKR